MEEVRRREKGWLRERTVLVTGAASGLGRGIALAFAEAGSDLALVDIDGENLEETASLVRKLGRRCSTWRVDVSDRGEMEKLAEEVHSRWGGVDVLVNNAGVGVGGELVDLPVEDIEWIVGVNLMGEVYGTRFFLPAMLERGEGHVVNVGSLSSLVVLPLHIAYTTTKYGVAGFSEALWVECRRHGVGVTLVCPGAVSTNIMQHARGRYRTSRQWKSHERYSRLLSSKGMDPMEAGRRIREAVLRGKFLLLLGFEAHLLYWLKRFSPGLQLRLAAAAHSLVSGE